jgi:hypothetical protein
MPDQTTENVKEHTMKPLRIVRILAATVALLALAAAGCGNVQKAGQRVKASNDLKQLGLLYHNYWAAFAGKGPSGPKDPDFVKMVASDGAKPLLDAVDSGKYVLYWGVSMADLRNSKAGMSNTILGYEKDVPTAGGTVLMADASTQVMTADDFKSAAKAK